jgi:hypothetical protein
MTVIQIIELILSLAPSGISLTTDILNLIKEIEGVVSSVPAESQVPVATVASKALVAKT